MNRSAGMVGAKLANIKDGEFAGNQHVASANLPTPHISQSDAAEMLNVSTRMVTAATKVLAEAPEEVSHAVEAGTVSINRARSFRRFLKGGGLQHSLLETSQADLGGAAS